MWRTVAYTCIIPLHHSLMLFSMTFRVISCQIKEHAVWLLKNSYLFDDICDILGISWHSVEQWQQNSEHFGEVIPPHKQRGWPHILPARARSDVRELIDASPKLYLDEIHNWITVAYDLELQLLSGSGHRHDSQSSTNCCCRTWWGGLHCMESSHPGEPCRTAVHYHQRKQQGWLDNILGLWPCHLRGTCNTISALCMWRSVEYSGCYDGWWVFGCSHCSWLSRLRWVFWVHCWEYCE